MTYFVYNYNHDEEDILTKIARYHIEFEKIHPFEDGNGRTGRLLLNYELLKNNIPPVVISKEERVKYFEFLRNNDSTGLAEWLRSLSTEEKERMEKFGLELMEEVSTYTTLLLTNLPISPQPTEIKLFPLLKYLNLN